MQPDPGFFFIRFTGDCDAGGLIVMNGTVETGVQRTDMWPRVYYPIGLPPYLTIVVVGFWRSKKR